MKVSSLNEIKQWLKTSDHPAARMIFDLLKKGLNFELPAPKAIFSPCYTLYVLVRNILASFMRILFWTPLFKGRLNKVGKNLNLYGGLPYISGPVSISLGDDCRVSGQSTFTGRSCAQETPTLTLGDNIDIGWMTTIAVGSKVELGNNVRIAGRALLAGYPGHPLDALARAQGLPETDDQVADIIIEEDVWLATGVSVMAGVRIGHGSIIAAGSVVTHDIPALVLAGGVPAKVIRSIAPPEEEVQTSEVEMQSSPEATVVSDVSEASAPSTPEAEASLASADEDDSAPTAPEDETNIINAAEESAQTTSESEAPLASTEEESKQVSADEQQAVQTIEAHDITPTSVQEKRHDT